MGLTPPPNQADQRRRKEGGRESTGETPAVPPYKTKLQGWVRVGKEDVGWKKQEEQEEEEEGS